MPEETIREVAMTHYEIIATVLAFMALIQPWAIALFKKVFKPLKVSFIPSAKIKLYYNRSGAYIYQSLIHISDPTRHLRISKAG